MKLFSQKFDAFGLDISDFSLKIAKLERSGEALRLVSFGSSSIPVGIIENGEVKDEKSLGSIIKKSTKEVKGEKLKTNYVIVSLPEEKSFLDVLQLPVLKEEEIAQAVRFEAANQIPLPLEEVYFDFEKTEAVRNYEKYQEVLIAATPKEIVDSYLEALKEARLQPLALEVECLAIVRALIKKNISHRSLLIIDFGGNRTGFMLFSGKSLRFTSTIPISSRDLTESIAKTMGLEFAKAEELKREQGLEGNKEVFEAMIPPLTDLLEQIKTHLDYYYSHEKGDWLLHNGRELERILLCGGGANLKGLVNFLTSELKVKVELGNPWLNILKEPLREIPALSFEESLGYTTALGLALRGIEGG